MNKYMKKYRKTIKNLDRSDFIYSFHQYFVYSSLNFKVNPNEILM